MSTLKNIANEINQPARKTFCKTKNDYTIKDDLWQADLIDMQANSNKNKGFRYILIVIDTYTKYVWVQPVTNKTAKEVTKCMFNILKKYYPKLLQTDNGTEFYNTQFQNLMKRYSIKHYSIYSSIKAGIVERVIRTLKNKLYTYFIAVGSYNWINSTSKLIHKI